MQPKYGTLRRDRRIIVSGATALALGLTLASPPAVAQNRAPATRDGTAHAAGSDSARTAASIAACARLKAYRKQVAADSIKALWKGGTLLKLVDSITTQIQKGQEPHVDLTPVSVPDSIRPIARAAGPSCDATPTVETVAELLAAQLKAPRPFIGIHMRDVSPQDAASVGLRDTRGVLVESVTPGYGAQAAGIVAGDVIVAIDGKPVDSLDQFWRQAASWKAPGTVVVEVARKGGGRRRMNVTVKMRR